LCGGVSVCTLALRSMQQRIAHFVSGSKSRADLKWFRNLLIDLVHLSEKHFPLSAKGAVEMYVSCLLACCHSSL